jgi:hypothetical protein
MHLKTWDLGILISSYCSTYRVADPFSSLDAFSSSSIAGLGFYPIDDCEYLFLYLPVSGIASQDTALSGSLQQNLAGICNSFCIWWLIMWWIPRWASLWTVHPFVSALNFVSVTPSMGILFPIVRRNEVSTRRSSFLIFLCFANCILGILSLWANIYLSLSAYQVTSDTLNVTDCCEPPFRCWEVNMGLFFSFYWLLMSFTSCTLVLLISLSPHICPLPLQPTHQNKTYTYTHTHIHTHTHTHTTTTTTIITEIKHRQ